LIFELRERNRPEIVLSNCLQIHFLQLYGLLKGRNEVLAGVSPGFRHWLNFMAFGGLKEEQEMAQLVENNPLVMGAVAELQRFSSDPDMRELERRRKLWKLEYYSGLTAAKEEGKAEGKAETLLKILRKRFNKIPRDVESTICKMSDPVALDSWAEHALDCQSMADFTQAIR